MEKYMLTNKLQEIMCNIVSCYRHIPYTWRHYIMVLKLQKKYIGTIKYPFHDLDKLLMYIFLPFLGTKTIKKIHRKNCKHHISDDKTIENLNFEEAIIDWESARYTKPDKQLNARETIEYYKKNSKYYGELIKQLEKFGL